MSSLPARSSHRTGPPGRPRRPWRRAAAGAAALVLAASVATIAGGPARADAAPDDGSAGCLTVQPRIGGQSCDREDPGHGTQVALTSPTDGSYLVSVCAVRLTADASTRSGTISRVEFYLNNQLVGSDASAPYGMDVPPTHPALGAGGSGPRHTAFARAVTVSPPATADSPTVNFGLAPPPPALMVIACPSRVQVPEGGTTTMTFVTVCAGTPGLDLTVTGDAGISVTPTVSPPGNREHRITVIAAPGSAGAVARITARAESGNCMPGSAGITVGPAAGTQDREMAPSLG